MIKIAKWLRLIDKLSANEAIIGSDNDFSSVWHQAII